MIDKTVFSINLWDVYQKEGRQCAEKGDLDGALERFQAALEKAESYGSNDPRVASSKRCVAEVFSKQGKLAEAAKLYDDALELLEQELGEDSSTLLKTLRSYAKLLTQTDDTDMLAKVSNRIAEIESKSSESVVTSDIFEECLPDDADVIPMTPEQKMRIMELLQRGEVSEKSRTIIMGKLDESPTCKWAHECQGKMRREIVRSYQPESLRNKDDEDEICYD
jgi:tetratricopeptide (TPR) repeat protein